MLCGTAPGHSVHPLAAGSCPRLVLEVSQQLTSKPMMTNDTRCCHNLIDAGVMRGTNTSVNRPNISRCIKNFMYQYFSLQTEKYYLCHTSLCARVNINPGFHYKHCAGLGVRRKSPLFGVGEIRNLWENCQEDYHIMDDNFIQT